jgi:hypothetical protein
MTDFDKRIDEIADEYTHLLSFGGEDFSAIKDIVKSAMLSALEEFAKLEPSDGDLFGYSVRFGLDEQCFKSACRAMRAAQLKEIQGGKK